MISGSVTAAPFLKSFLHCSILHTPVFDILYQIRGCFESFLTLCAASWSFSRRQLL